MFRLKSTIYLLFYSKSIFTKYWTSYNIPIATMAESPRPRIFMTGANGYIGSIITQFAISEGYEVYGLSRTEKSDAKLKSLGAVPVRGDLHALDFIRRESANAQVVIHLADPLAGNFAMDYEEVLRIGNAAVDAMAEPLQGTGKPLLVTSGTLVVAPATNGAETTEASPLSETPMNGRIRGEQHALSWVEKGVHVVAIRLAPYVYGRGGSGVRLFMRMAVRNGEVVCIDDGAAKTSVVHVDDAARLYLLAVRKAKAGDVFNATSSTDVTARQLAEAMAFSLELPVRSVPFEDAKARFGEFFARFLSAKN
jgi:nucleoside-diphosphate-sugar epimerase